MTTKFSKFSGNESNSDSESSPTHQRSVRFVDNNFLPIPGRKDCPVGAPKSILKSPGSPNSPQNKGSPKHSPSGSRQLEEWFHGSQSIDRSEFASPRRKRARLAAKINPAERDGVPVITSIPHILSSLGNDEHVHGNLIVTADESASDEIMQIWRAYELTQPMSIAVICTSSKPGPTISFWWDLKKRVSPYRYKVTVLQAAEMGDGPTPRTSIYRTTSSWSMRDLSKPTLRWQSVLLKEKLLYFV